MPNVNRADLLRVLETVQPGLSPKDAILQSTAFVFRKGKVITFNGEVSARMPSGLPAELTGAVQADQLLQLLRHLKDDNIDVEFEEGEFRVYAERREAGIRMEAEIVLPLDQVERPGDWVDLPPEFGEALKLAGGSAGKNQDEFVTVCVHVHPDWVEACDRFQACRYKLDTGVREPFLVRWASAKHVTAFGITEMSETESWVHFANPAGLVLSVRRFNDAFPHDRVTKLLEERGERTVLPPELADAAKLAGIFSGEDRDQDMVLVELRDGKVRITGEGTLGWARETTKIVYHGPPLAFRVSPAQLSELVQTHNECELMEKKLRVDGGKWTYVTCLFQPKEKKASKKESEVATA